MERQETMELDTQWRTWVDGLDRALSDPAGADWQALRSLSHQLKAQLQWVADPSGSDSVTVPREGACAEALCRSEEESTFKLP